MSTTPTSPSQCQHQQILELNNAGVSALVCGDASSAFKTFHGTLLLVQNLTHSETSNDLLSHSTIDCGSPAVEIAWLKDPYFYVYNRPVLLDVSPRTDLTIANASLLFNLALTFHQHGHMTNDTSKLQKALRLYDLAVQIILQSNRTSSSALAVAALNNQAHIYYTVGDYSHSEELLERVQESLLELVANPMDAPILEDDLNEIYLNLIVIEPPTAAPSA